MTKVFVRTLDKSLWINSTARDTLRRYLNDLGFYVLTGIDDTLVVYALKEEEPWLRHFVAIIVRRMLKRQIDLN